MSTGRNLANVIGGFRDIIQAFCSDSQFWVIECDDLIFHVNRYTEEKTSHEILQINMYPTSFAEIEDSDVGMFRFDKQTRKFRFNDGPAFGTKFMTAMPFLFAKLITLSKIDLIKNGKVIIYLTHLYVRKLFDGKL